MRGRDVQTRAEERAKEAIAAVETTVSQSVDAIMRQLTGKLCPWDPVSITDAISTEGIVNVDLSLLILAH